ncbi:gliding motility-associated C-terminal domain-containing protein [Mesonia sp.]|uniref:T9SS type B sorting domain-containing protein n=1 Tax=Mesonia sp. TaxID=1960830 RepID=UPI001767713A|nr:gliding motility-associated C-terminal domain-containing protein [Mesonia sp.]HIB37915.1 hypothetical protein [Mesonia sp.]
MVIADRADSILDSAVFIEAGSFDVGELDLGADLFVGCSDEEAIIDSGLPDNFVGTIEWYFNPENPTENDLGELIVDQNNNPVSSPSIQVAETGFYTVTVSVGNASCAVDDTVEVNFNSEIGVDLPNEINFCTGEVYEIDATPLNESNFENLNYTWYLNGDVIPDQNSSVLIVSEQGEYTVLIDAENSQCLPVSHTIQVDSINYTVDFDQSQTVCVEVNGETDFELVPLISGIPQNTLSEVSYLWNDGSENSTLIINESGSYQVTVNYRDCIKIATINIDYGIMPNVEAIQSIEICEGSVASFSAQIENLSDYSTVSYEWLNIQNEIISSSQDISILQAGSYTLNVSAENSSGIICEYSQNFEVSYKDLQLVLPNDQTLCGETYFLIEPQLSGEDLISPEFTWQDQTGAILSNNENIEVTTSGIYTFTVATSECSISRSISINFVTIPIIDLGNDIYTCLLEENLPNINATPENIDPSSATFTWYFNDEIIPNESSSILETSTYGYGDYAVEVSIDGSSNCNSIIDTISIQKEQDIFVEINSNDLQNTYCVGEDVVLNLSITGTTSDLQNNNYRWYENGSLLEESTSVLSFDMSDSFNSPTLYEVFFGEGACEASASIEIFKYANEDCLITEGLSPNTSIGLNDNLDLKFLDDRSNILSIKIFNRYGTLVYSKQNYRDEFTGKDNNGNDLVTGTYYYVIELDNSDSVFGSIIKHWIYINQTTK